MIDAGHSLPSVLGVETERERELDQQLKQASDTVARLQDKLADFWQRSAPLWKKEFKNRNSMINLILLSLFFFIKFAIIMASDVNRTFFETESKTKTIAETNIVE